MCVSMCDDMFACGYLLMCNMIHVPFLHSGHTGKIKVVQFKLALTTLCNGSVEEKYQC